jgi:hypothetical protein
MLTFKAPAMKCVDGHEQAGHVKQRQQVQMDVGFRQAEAVIEMQAGAQKVGMAHQRSPWPTGNGGRVDDHQAGVGVDLTAGSKGSGDAIRLSNRLEGAVVGQVDPLP